MCICASWLPMPRLPECSTTHTRCRSSTHSSKKWLPEPSVPNCFAALLAWSSTSSVAGLCVASHASALWATWSWPLPTPAGIACLDAAEQRLERVGQLALGDVELGGDHAAADVDADRRRDHGALRRDHRAHRRADADVCVRHERDVALDDRKSGGLLRLAKVSSSISLAHEISLSLMWLGMSPSFLIVACVPRRHDSNVRLPPSDGGALIH